MLDVIDGFSGDPISLGDNVRSLERGDEVRVVALGEAMSDDGNVEPLVMLEPRHGAAYRAEVAECDGTWVLVMYSAR